MMIWWSLANLGPFMIYFENLFAHHGSVHGYLYPRPGYSWESWAGLMPKCLILTQTRNHEKVLLCCHVTVTAFSIHQEKLIHGKCCVHLNLWPCAHWWETSLHKHKMGAHDSMLGYLISTRLSFFLNLVRNTWCNLVSLCTLGLIRWSGTDYLRYAAGP